MNYSQILFLIGRFLYGGFFLHAAWDHFFKAEMFAGYAASKGVASPKLAVYGSGVLLLIGGLGILSGSYVWPAVAALILFLAGVSLKMHAFWKESGEARAMDKVQFLKNMALLGAALVFLVIPEPWSYSINF